MSEKATIFSIKVELRYVLNYFMLFSHFLWWLFLELYQKNISMAELLKWKHHKSPFQHQFEVRISSIFLIAMETMDVGLMNPLVPSKMFSAFCKHVNLGPWYVDPTQVEKLYWCLWRSKFIWSQQVFKAWSIYKCK